MIEETVGKLWEESSLKKKECLCIKCGALFNSLEGLAKGKCRSCEEQEELEKGFGFLLGARIEEFAFETDTSRMESKCSRILVRTKHGGRTELSFENAGRGIFIVEEWQRYADWVWCKTVELEKKFLILRDAKIEKFYVVPNVFSPICRALVVSSSSGILFELMIELSCDGLVAREICKPS